MPHLSPCQEEIRGSWNELCPLDRVLNRVFFALVVSVNHLSSIYAIFLSIAFLIKMITLKNNGSGVIQRWSCSCAAAGILPILVQNCIQIYQTTILNADKPFIPLCITWTRPLTIATQFLRNWIYASASCVEYYLSTNSPTLQTLHFLNLLFYAQVAFIILLSIPFYHILAKVHPYRTLMGRKDFEELPLLFVVQEKGAGVVRVVSVPLFVHLLPVLILVVLKIKTAKQVLTLPASDRGLEARWSLVTTQIYTAVTMCGLAVGISVEEIGVGLSWSLWGSWESTAAAAMVDAITVIMVMGAANSESAFQHSAGGRRWHVGWALGDNIPVCLRLSICGCCLRVKRMSVFRANKE